MTTVDLSERPKRSRHSWAIGVWTITALLFGLMMHFQLGLTLRYTLPHAVFYFYTLGALVTIVGRINRRLHERALGAWRLVGVHLGLSLVVLAIWQGLNVLYLRLAIGPHFWAQAFASSWIFQIAMAAAIYSVALGVVLIAQMRQRERERERHEAELTITARDAELAALRAQLQPHFVFNALNSILALMETDPARARAMLVRLAEVMRAFVMHMDREVVTVDSEITLAREYLEIERIRFSERLVVTLDVADDARALLVPPLLLQPLIENAVRHGVARDPRGATIHIAARRSADRLQLEVRNSMGQSVRAANASGEPIEGSSGRGLELTRRRLATAYDGAATLGIDSGAGNFSVRIALPARSHGD